MKPGQAGLTMVPIHRMLPRSFVANLRDGATVKAGGATTVRGIAFGGVTGVKADDLSTDGGAVWAGLLLAFIGHPSPGGLPAPTAPAVASNAPRSFVLKSVSVELPASEAGFPARPTPTQSPPTACHAIPPAW